MGYGFPAAIGAKVANPEQRGVQHLRRRQHPDEHPGACHVGGEQYPGEGRDPEQPLPRHGAAVAGAVLPGAVFVRGPRQHAGFRESWPRPTAPSACARRSPSDVVPVLKEALKAKRTVFMDFVTARYEKVFPMVPAGASINEMIFGEEKKKEEKKLKAVK